MFTAEVWNGAAAWSFRLLMLFSPDWFPCCVWLWDCAGQRRGLVVRQRVSGLFAISCGFVRMMCAWDPKLASFACILPEPYHPLAVFRSLYQLVDLTEECVHQKLMSVCGAQICLNLLQQHIHWTVYSLRLHAHREKNKNWGRKLVRMSLVHSLDKTYFLRLSRSLVCFCVFESFLWSTLSEELALFGWFQSVHIVASLITLAMRRWDWGCP